MWFGAFALNFTCFRGCTLEFQVLLNFDFIVNIQYSQFDGLQRKKKGGEKLETWFNPSNVKIVNLYEDDSRRMKNSKKKVVKTEEVEKKETVKEINVETKQNKGEHRSVNPKISRAK